MSLKKHLLTCCAVLAICVAASPAVYADTTLNMQANSVAGDAADYSGYRIKWYTTNTDGSRTENTTILTDTSGACTLTIPDEAFGLGYEIYTSDGELVSDFKQLLTGSPQFWDNTEPIWFDLAPKASQMPNDLTVVNDDDSVTSLDLSYFGISGSTPQGNTSSGANPSSTTQPSVQTPEYVGKVRVVSDINIDLLRNQGITFYATQGGQQNRIDLSLLPSEYSDFALPSSGLFTFSISGSAVSAWSSVEIANTGDNMAEIKVVPKCLLYVTNGGKEVKAQVLNTGYRHPDKITLGVRNGEEYTIIDMTTNKAYRFVVPSNVTECALDFSTMDGVPVNELAQQDATLTNSGDFDNPYNVPLTDEQISGEELGKALTENSLLPSANAVISLFEHYSQYIELCCCMLGVMLIVISMFLILVSWKHKRLQRMRLRAGFPQPFASEYNNEQQSRGRFGSFKDKVKMFFLRHSAKRNGAETDLPIVLWDDNNIDNGEE